MIAACAKLMSNLDLVLAARKIRVVVHANNTVGLPGRLSIRLQPNHPSDSIEGILASLKDGLSFGAGDAVIGINPVTDDPGDDRGDPRTRRGDFMRQWRMPTQNCCLAHVTTQMKALETGRAARPDVPVDRAAPRRRCAASASRCRCSTRR